MKKALVLSGGGAKGAYEAGCIKALHELNETFDIVTGTSIGALNGLLYAQQDYEVMEQLWRNLTIQDVMKEPIQLSIEGLLKQSNLIIPFFKSYMNEKGADITPLKNLIFSLYDEQKFKNNKIDYGIVTVSYPMLKPIEITKKDMQENDAVNYAIASASCFPAFPIYNYKQQQYIDGGYYDNLPISLAFELGADEVLAIELKKEITHPHYHDRPNIKYIRPYEDLGSFLDFGRNTLDLRMTLGYFDTMKTYKKLQGYQYTFTSKPISKTLVDTFYHHILSYENMLNRSKFSNVINDPTPLTTSLMGHCYKNQLEKEDYAMLGLEATMRFYEYPVDVVYEVDDIIKKIKKRFSKEYNTSFLFSKEMKQHLKNGYSLRELPFKETLYYLYSSLEKKENMEVTFSTNIFGKELVIALFLSIIMKQS